MDDCEGSRRQRRDEPHVLSVEDIHNYVKELLCSSNGGRSDAQHQKNGKCTQRRPLTVEHILEKVYGRFFNQKGQSPFPDGLPFALKQIPSIAKVAEIQLRITALVQCAVASRPVVTLYELELEVCSAEGVETYADLGLGDSLAALPFVRHAFNLRSSMGVTAPVTSTDFLRFLLFDESAEIMLTSGGDAGDAVRAFAQHFKNGCYTPLQLRIHIQHFSWLLRFLRQEVGRMEAVMSQIVAENTRELEGNALVYTRALGSLHASLMLQGRAITASRKLSVPFVLRASVPEAETTSIPLTSWNQASDGPTGGICLYGVLQTDPVPVSTSVSTKTEKDEASGLGFGQVTPHSSVAAATAGTDGNSVRGASSSPFAFAHARRRQRRVVAEDVTAVVEASPSSTAGSSHEGTFGGTIRSLTSLPSPLSLSPTDAMSILRCLAVMRSSHYFLNIPTARDFGVLRLHADEVAPRFMDMNTLKTRGSGGQTAACGPFHITLDALLNLLAHGNASSELYNLYRCMSHKGASADSCSAAVSYSPLLKCIQAEMLELLFLPVVGTDSLLPLIAAKTALSGRVLLSGCSSTESLLEFHPLHLVLHPVCGHDGDSYTSLGDRQNDSHGESNQNMIFIVDSRRLFGLGDTTAVPHSLKLYDKHHEHEEEQSVRRALHNCGVLLRVPEDWFDDGLLANVLKRIVEEHHTTCKGAAEDLHMALRMLTFYWWLIGLCFSKVEPCIAEKAAKVLHCLSDVHWIPSVASSTRTNPDTLTLGTVRWHSPRELFPSIQCFFGSGASELLSYAPHACEDLIDISQQLQNVHCADQQNPQTLSAWSSTVCFLDKWISAVRRHIGVSASLCGEFQAAILGMPRSWTADVALKVLRTLKVGKSVSLAAIRHLLQCIISDDRTSRNAAISCLKQEPLIPLPAPKDALKFDEILVIGELTTCSTVHWLPLTDFGGELHSSDGNGKEGTVGEVLRLFDRSISFFGDSFRDFFLDSLSVSPTPTITSWVAAGLAVKRHVPAGPLIDSRLTAASLSVLSIACKAQYNGIVKILEGGSNSSGTEHSLRHGVAQAALDELLNCVPTSGRTAYIFPLDGRWRAGAEGLFFCGTYYCGVDGVALVAVDNEEGGADSTEYQLPVLKFTEGDPHYTVAAVLRKLGVTALEESTEKIVSFNGLNTESSAALHCAIGECVPRVQGFLRTEYPLYYEIVKDGVQRRLDRFGTTLAKEPTLKEVLRYRGKTYCMVRTIRCAYVQQHFCIYGVDEQFTPSVGAEAIADIFMPLVDMEVRHGLMNALQHWFNSGSLEVYSDGSSFGTELPRDSPPFGEVTTPSNEQPWQLSAASASRFRDHFPLGREGFSLVGKVTPTSRGPSDGGARNANLRVTPWGSSDGYSVRSLPQWSCELFDPWLAVARSATIGSGGTGDSLSRDVVSANSTGEVVDNSGGYRSRRGEWGEEVTAEGRNCRKRARQNTGPMVVFRPEGPLKRYDARDYSVAAERFVYEKLCNESPEDVEVVWVNEHSEIGVPYDILLLRRHASHPKELRHTRDRSDKGDVVAFIEVKSTCTNARRDFEMSLREVLFAARFGRAYKVYRVFRASTSVMREMHLEVLEDVITMWYEGKLTLTGDVKVMPTSNS